MAGLDANTDELLVVLHAGGRRCALRAGQVVEVHPLVLVSPLPHSPALVEGVIDAHGELIPVLDLGQSLGDVPQSAEPDHMLVIVDTDHRRLALHVEHEVELVSVEAADLREATLAEAAFAEGFVVLPDGLVVIHDIDAFLSAEDRGALEQALMRRAAST